MTERLSVSGSGLERKRRKAVAHGRGLVSEFGWHVDCEVAGKLVSAFPRLRVRPGFKLATIVFRGSSGGNGWTHAFPCNIELPSRENVEEEDEFPPNHPVGSLANVMDGIEGDGSLRSFIEASILGRELSELGARWHGIDWGTHSLLDGESEPASLSGNWTWSEDQSRNRAPFAVRNGSTVTVTFWTATSLGEEAVIRHSDTYEDGVLRIMRTSDHTVATGQGGYIF